MTTPVLPRSPWLRFRLAITAGLLGVATVTGVSVGLQGAAVSPVEGASAASAEPASGSADDADRHDRRRHR